ncbi:MAG TPA: hypothetical protein VN736_00520 [Candidatus Limnocylindrales bacterium]|jgi:hypothetical protein|nr:hypothetical protein [Candidatus Limnocylindrales bacterium]
MRYWAYFAAKLLVAAGIAYEWFLVVDIVRPEKVVTNEQLADQLARISQYFAYDTALMIWFLACAGALYLIIRDQRYRCRVCLRKLMMPVETGSWGRMLQLGRPRIEYICPYGHGTLKAEELQISGLATPEWTPHSDDIWAELEPAKDEQE